uniref:Uncharacterized protein n=1 Tax=Tanacetum cinerariifolium TaxID=118510 RepID=A0A6L2N1D6_TANCI|nr:hypothetical protein [Tanacetum cinerariifolium]
MVTESLKQEVLAKESSQPKSSYEAAATLTEFELKKILIDKMDKSESYLAAPEHRECYKELKKSYNLDKTFFTVYGKVYSLKRSQKDKDKDEDPSNGSDRGLNKRKTSKDVEPTKDSDMPHDQEENPDNDDEPKEKVASKRDWFTKPTQPQKPTDPDSFRLLKGTRSNYAEFEYDFEECYTTLLEKLNWKNPKGGDYPFDLNKPLPLVKIRNLQKVDVMKKHGYGYLQEIIVRRADNELYRFKEETTKSGIEKRDLYTPYQYPQGFIYVDDSRRNRLMRSDELYMFGDGTLTRLRTSLGDITKNIQMEYLPKRRWSTLEKKRANIMIKAIDKQLKERRMMRSLEKFVGGRDYGTDLQLPQRTI